MDDVFDIWFDGACQGNPGPGAGGAVIYAPGGKKHIVWKPLEHCTNNEAEWTGLIVGLRYAVKIGAKKVAIRGDSRLVVMQASGGWRIKKSHLHQYKQKADYYLKRLEVQLWAWVPREMNGEADAASRGIGALLLS